MKINKLLILNAIIASLTPALVCASCGDNPNPTPDAEKIADYIFNPTDLTETHNTKDWFNTLLGWSQDELTAEVYYDLFGWFNWPNLYGIGNDKTFKDLYRDNTVGIKTNIGKCDVTINQESRTMDVTFLGYVSFVFVKDLTDEKGDAIFKKDDYVMLTYELKNFAANPSEDQGEVGFVYEYPTSPLPYCLGFFKVRKVDQEFLNYIEEINTIEWEGVPANSQNFIKQPTF